MHNNRLDYVIYTLAAHCEHLLHRAYASIDEEVLPPSLVLAAKAPLHAPDMAFVFTGQGAQWVGMGLQLIHDYPSALRGVSFMDEALSKFNPEQAPIRKSYVCRYGINVEIMCLS